MKTSQFKKIHRDILLEWVYDDNNILADPFKIITNNRDNTKSYVGTNLTSNIETSQLFALDIIQKKYSVYGTQFTFIDIESHTASPIRHDTLKINFPGNYDFNQYIGIYVRVYAYDYNNRKLYDLSNFYYDKNDSDTSQYTPPLLYENRLWDKQIVIEIPSVNAISNQVANGTPVPDTINDVLTNGVGMSFTTPIFIDFHFITGTSKIGNNPRQYYITEATSTQFTQSPELSEISLLIQESLTGDYFEIIPLFLNSFEKYLEFIDISTQLGKVYYNEFNITIFEQNIKGKKTRIIVSKNFEDIVQWRPIIKSSTINAVIDVEMRLIDKVDGSIIERKASYGLKPNQTSKYQLRTKKILVKNTSRAKIYVKKEFNLANLDAITRRDVKELSIKIDSPNLIDVMGVKAASDNAINKKYSKKIDNYHANGLLKIIIKPFDNIIRFSLAIVIDDKFNFLDLSTLEIKLVFKAQKILEFNVYNDNNMDITNGMVNFLISQKNYLDIKKIYNSGNNFFYITANNKNVRTILYSGQFIPDDEIVITNEEDDNLIIVPVINTVEDNNIALVTKRAITRTNII